MSSRLRIATRKGLFTAEKQNGTWAITRADFLGDNVSLTLTDPRDATLYAALDHGHFGVKLHRLTAGATDWEEIATPAYPEKPEGHEEFDMWGRPLPWTTVRIWALASCGAARCLAASKSPTTAATHGRLFRRSGTTPCVANGWAVAPTCPACIPSASTRAMRSTSPSPFPLAACGIRPTAAKAGSSAAKACVPITYRLR